VGINERIILIRITELASTVRIRLSWHKLDPIMAYCSNSEEATILIKIE
jgi:hypothetical protein